MEIVRSKSREFAVEKFDEAAERTLTFPVSSEAPVERFDWGREGFYNEILSHDIADIDLSRFRDGAPILDTHNGDVIGVIEKVELIERRLVVTARFSQSARASEIFADIRDGIRRNVSVGYQLLERLSSEVVDGVENWRFRWMPVEVSVVPVPADPTVGFGRALQIGDAKKQKLAKKTILLA